MRLRPAWPLAFVAACTPDAAPPPSPTATPPEQPPPAAAPPGDPPPPSTTWLARFAGADAEKVRWVAAVSDGSTLAVGIAGDEAAVTTSLAPPAAPTVPPEGPRRTFAARFGPHGEPGLRVGFTEPEEAGAAAPASDGGFVVVGVIAGAKDGESDAFVARHDAAGKQTWRRVVGGAGAQEVWQVAALPGGDWAIAGFTDGMATYGDDAAIGGSSGAFIKGKPDGFVARIADDGALRWSSSVDGTGEVTAQGLGVGADGSIAVAGICGARTEVRPALGMGASLACGEGVAVYAAKWAPDGQLRWARRIPGPDGDIQTPADATILSDGDVAVIGMFRDGIGGDGVPLLRDRDRMGRDGFVVRLASADGAPRWIRQLSGDRETGARATAAGADGELWVAADFAPGMTIGDGATTTAATLRGRGPALLRFDPAGAGTFVGLIGNKAADDPHGVHVSHMAFGTDDVLRVAGSFGKRFTAGPQPGAPTLDALVDDDGFVLAVPAPR